MRALADRHPGLDPARIDDVFLGDANAAGDNNRDVARRAGIGWGDLSVVEGGGWGLAAICIGVGQGLAVVPEA